MRKCFVAGLLVSAAVSALPAAAAAAPKSGCPASNSGWQELTIQEAADDIYAGLLEKPAEGASVIVAELDALVDRNRDTKVCLLTRWGEHLNPKSHWHRIGVDAIGEPTTLFIAVDNNANAGK